MSITYSSSYQSFLRQIALTGMIGFLVACGGAGSGTDETGSTGGTIDTGGTGGSTTSTLEVSVPTPSTYEWDTLAIGSLVYIDRSYTYSSIPANLIGDQYLRTANADKTSPTSDSSLSFTINKTVDVYVGHANNDSARPSWLSTWLSTGDVLVSDDRTLYLYKKAFDAGTVMLSSGTETGSSMYVVIVDDGTTGDGGGGGGGGGGGSGDGGTPVNTAPTISGTPSINVTAGTTYSFTPTANDVDGDNLIFSITNTPSWASFNTSTGTLSGTPSSGDEGSFSGITITVSDGTASDSLPAFSIAVLPVASGTASLSWTPPTTNEDGTNLDDLAGYKIYYGTTQGSYPNVISVNNGVASHIVENLAPNTYYFVITAYDFSGNESPESNVATKTI